MNRTFISKLCLGTFSESEFSERERNNSALYLNVSISLSFNVLWGFSASRTPLGGRAGLLISPMFQLLDVWLEWGWWEKAEFQASGRIFPVLSWVGGMFSVRI